MKSILALIVIVSIAYAGVYTGKEGGLKGSWTDEIELESATPDLTAPGIAYYNGDSDYAVVDINYGDFDDTKTYNATYMDYTYVTGTFQFQATGEPSVSSYYDFETTGSIVAFFWTGAGDALRTIPISCSVYDSTENDIYCTFYVYNHMTPGVYKPSITLIDMFGNWATYDETAFTDATNNGVWTLQDEHPDTTAPTIATFVVSSTEGEVGTTADLDDDSVFVEFSATVGDGFWSDFDGSYSDEPTYDWRSSSVQGVYVTVTDEDGESSDWMLTKGVEVGDNAGTYKYGTRITFYPTMNAGVWTVDSIWAVDRAGNKNVMAQTDVTYTLTQSDAVEEDGGVFSCQSFTIRDADAFDPTINYVVDDSDDIDIYWDAVCTPKSTANSNYLAAALRTPEVILDGNTEETQQLYWAYQSGCELSGWVKWDNLGYGVSYTQTSFGVEAGDACEPGQTVDTLGLSTDYFSIPPNANEGDWELAEVYTITEFGAMQRYSIEFGSASAAAPSVFAVAVAAAVALLL
jgi:hypothetical protein